MNEDIPSGAVEPDEALHSHLHRHLDGIVHRHAHGHADHDHDHDHDAPREADVAVDPPERD